MQMAPSPAIPSVGIGMLLGKTDAMAPHGKRTTPVRCGVLEGKSAEVSSFCVTECAVGKALGPELISHDKATADVPRYRPGHVV